MIEDREQAPIVTIRSILRDDFDAWVALRLALWAGRADDHRTELERYFIDETIAGIRHAVFIAEAAAPADSVSLVGFAECSLRNALLDRANAGTHLEGWYVSPAFRRMGVGRMLINAVVDWASSQGCGTLTSDTYGRYAALSKPAHLACGFQLDPTVASNLGQPEDGTTAIGFSRVI